jgi:proline iminopeptidase
MRVDVGGLRLFFDVEGSGLVADGTHMAGRRSVVCIHGGPGADHSVFKPWLSPLSDVAQLVYLDLRGSGRSDRGQPSDWEWDRWGQDVIAFCDALEIEAPVLLGTSCGAWVALASALDHPGRIAGLVLDSAMPASHEQSVNVFRRTGGTHAAEVARRFFGGESGEEITKAWAEHCLPLYARRAPQALEEIAGRMTKNPEVEWRLRSGEMAPFDAWSRFDQITCPTLVLAGQDDPMTPANEAARLVAALVNAPVTLEVYPACGHGVFREMPPEALASTRRFLAALP